MVAQSIAVCLLLMASVLSASADAPWNGYRGVQGVYPPPQHRYGVPYPLQRETFQSTTSEPEEVDTDEDDNPSSSLVGSLLSLIPGGLSGILSLSSGSFRSKRSLIDPQTQADFVDYVLQKKKEFVSGIARDAIFYAHRKKPVASAWVKDKIYSLLNGNHFSGAHSYAPSSDYDLSQPSLYPVEQPQVSYGVPDLPAPSYGVPNPVQLYPYPGEHLGIQQYSDEYDSGASNLELSRQFRHADHKEDVPANENGTVTTDKAESTQ